MDGLTPRQGAGSKDACAFAQKVAAMAADPAAHIALTPALVLQRRNAEIRRKWTRYALLSAAGVGAVVLAYVVISHRSKQSKAEQESSKQSKPHKVGLTPIVRRTSGASGGGASDSGGGGGGGGGGDAGESNGGKWWQWKQ